MKQFKLFSIKTRKRYEITHMIITILLILIIIWLLGISYFLYKMIQHYNTLTKDIHKKTLEEVLNELTRTMQIAKKDIDQLIIRCDTIEKYQKFHIQKIGLLRFNPFNDTGGDQSFILALLDAQSTGVVITALYSRSGTRWYAKKVALGKGFEHELSDEEKKAIKIAQEEKLSL